MSNNSHSLLLKSCFLVLTFLLLAGTSIDLHSQSLNKVVNGVSLTKEEKDMQIKIQRILRAYSSLGKFSGTAIFAKQGEPMYAYTNGYANLDYRVMNSLSAQYNTCEISQSFTSLAILQLAEKGLVNLHAPINIYIPDLPVQAGSEVSIHHLLTHTSGLFNFYDSENYREKFLDIETIDDLVELISKQSNPCYAAARQISPSNYVLLAAIIERMSNMTYKEYIETKILKPAGMENTAMYYWHESIFNKAVGYTFDDGKEPIVAADFFGAFPFGADAIYSTVEDLLIFDKALRSNRLLSQEYKEMMYDKYSPEDYPSDPYGYGWYSRDLGEQGGTCIYQTGNMEGLSLELRRYIDEDYTIIICSNYNDHTATEIAEAIELALFDTALVVPVSPSAYFVNLMIENDGVDFVFKNFEQLIADNNLGIEKVWTLNALGWSYMNKKDLTTALPIFQKNQEMFPTEDIVYDSLGDCHYRLGNYDEAQRNFEKRLAMIPNDKRATVMLESIELKKRKAKDVAKETN